MESVSRIINEGLYNDDICLFELESPMNGHLIVKVPYMEFMRAKEKLDLLWRKACEQFDIRLVRNGYFMPCKRSPHYEEIARYF